MDETSSLQSIASLAISSFHNKDYEKSTQLFQELKNKINNSSNQSSPTTGTNSPSTTNYEILMNLAISEYYRNNCSNPPKLLDELNSIYKSLSASTTVTPPSSSSSSSSTINTENGGGNIQSPLNQSTLTNMAPSPILTSSSPVTTSANSIQTTSLDSSSSTTANTTNQQQQQNKIDIDNDQAIVLYNQAVILYCMKQYGSSYNHLEILYHNVMFLDDYLAIRVCFLLINVSITVQLYDKANGVLSQLEQLFTHLFYTKETDEILSKITDATNNQEIDMIIDQLMSGGTSNGGGKWNHTLMSPIEFRFLIHFYKSKLFLLSKNHYLLAKDEIKNAINKALQINYSPLLPSCYLLKSNYFNQCLKPIKTINFLNQSRVSNTSNTTTNSINPLSLGFDISIEDITPQIFFNNIGCLHFNLQKYVSSIFYFSKALKVTSCADLPLEQQIKLPCSIKTIDKRTEIFYNTGTLLLVTGKPDLAFSCLQEACLLLYGNPLVWLRLAECCIMAHLNRLHESPTTTSTPTFIDDGARILLPTQNGTHQGLQIEDSDVQSTLTGEEPDESSSRLGTLSLEFAAKCLRNETEFKFQEDPIELMFSILASQAYVALCTYNPIVTLTVSKQLLCLIESESKNNNNNINYDKYKYYGHLYAAEACVMLNIPEQAIKFLSPNFIESIKHNLSTTIQDSNQQQSLSSPFYSDSPKNQLEYQNIFYINLAIAFILKEKLESAEQSIKTISIDQDNNSNENNIYNKINLLKVYLDLRRGNLENAFCILSKERPIPV
eukprot:gene4645-5803_t